MANHQHPRAIDHGLSGCRACGLLVRTGAARVGRCPRCHTTVRPRIRNSLQWTWALLIAGAILYVPANVLPIMTIRYFGAGQPDTIMSGVVFLLTHGMWPLALIVFVASVLVPLLKLFTLTYLLLSVHWRSRTRASQRTWIYRVTEFVGRWSMVDVFVVAILSALVQLGGLVTIDPGPGAVAFAGVVVLTMFAAGKFDPRLIWDHVEGARAGE